MSLVAVEGGRLLWRNSNEMSIVLFVTNLVGGTVRVVRFGWPFLQYYVPAAAPSFLIKTSLTLSGVVVVEIILPSPYILISLFLSPSGRTIFRIFSLSCHLFTINLVCLKSW